MPITRQEFEEIKKQAEQAILCHVERKDALLMAQKLEKTADEMKNSDPDFFDELQKIIAKLKWIASPILRDSQKFYNLVKQYLLEGLDIPELLEIVLTRLGFQMGYELQESLNILLGAMRQNTQTIGRRAIMIIGEQKPAKPTIQNWLIDFIRSSPAQTLTEVDETNYLFNNQNARTLSGEEKKILGNLLSLYSTLRFLSQEVARQAIYETREAQPRPLVARTRQEGENDFYEEPEEPYRAPLPQPPAQRVYQPPSLSPSQPNRLPRHDTFREPVLDEDLAGPQSVQRPMPKLDGNIVNLKDIGNNHS